MSRFELESFAPNKKDQFHANLVGVFVGCEKELDRLNLYLKDSANGAGHFIVISGEAGIGKSRFVQHFNQEAEQNGALTIEETFEPCDRLDPYLIFIRIINRLTKLNRKQSSNNNPDLTKFNNFANNIGDGKNIKDLEISSLYFLQTKYGLIQQLLASTLTEFTNGKWLVLTLNESHLAPQTTWQFIHYLGKSIAKQNILVLITLRQDGKKIQNVKVPVYADVLQRMNRERLIEKISIKRFNQNTIRQFLNIAFKQSDFSSQLIPLLYDISGGLPARLIRCLDEMYDKEILFEQNGIWFNKENLSKNQLLTPDEGQLGAFQTCFLKLNEIQKRILKYSVLMNGPFDYGLLSDILNISRIQLAKELVSLEEKKILIASGEMRYSFRNSGFSAIVSEQNSQEEQAEMHREIVLKIENSDSVDATEKIYALAYHYNFTENKKQAFFYLCKAFDLAITNLAFTEAKDFFYKCIAIYDTYPEDFELSILLDLLVKMIWLDRVLGIYEDSISHGERAYQLSVGNCYQDIRVQILIQQGLTYFRLNEWDKAKECFQECRAQEINNNPYVLAMVNFGLGNIDLELADYTGAKANYKKALNLAKMVNSESLIGTLYNNLGIIENILGNRMLSISFYSQSIPIFEKLGDYFGLARIYNNIGMVHADENSWLKANEFYGKSLSSSDVLGLLPLKSVTFLNRALALIHLKRYEEAREYNFKAFRLLEQLNDELGIAEFHKVQGVLEREEKKWQKAEKHFDQAITKFKTLKNKLGDAETKYELAILFMRMNNHQKARDALNRAKSDFMDLGLNVKVERIAKNLAKLQNSRPECINQ